MVPISMPGPPSISGKRLDARSRRAEGRLSTSLRAVAGDEQLRQHDEIGTEFRLGMRRFELCDVASEITNDGFQLCERDLQGCVHD